MFLLSASLTAPTLQSGVPLDDLTRARTKVPRNEYQTPVPNHMAKILNRHLTRSHPNIKPCHEWTAAELQTLQTEMYQHRAPAHDEIYQDVKDNRLMPVETNFLL